MPRSTISGEGSPAPSTATRTAWSKFSSLMPALS